MKIRIPLDFDVNFYLLDFTVYDLGGANMSRFHGAQDSYISIFMELHSTKLSQ